MDINSYEVRRGLIEKQRAEGKFIDDSIPYTRAQLIRELTSELVHLDKKSLIAVLYTIEWAIYLLSMGYTKIVLVTKEHDKYVAGWAKILKLPYYLLDNLVEAANMEFDVVVGNPPYNSGNEALWKKIAENCMALSNTIAFVTPRNIVNGVQTQKGSKGGFFEKLKPHLSYIDYNADNHFNVGKRICAWVYDRSHFGITKIKTSNSVISMIDIQPYGYLPYNFATLLDFSIFEKLSKHPKMLAFIDVKDKPAGACLVAPAIKHISLNFVIVVDNLATDSRVTAKDLVGYRLSHNEIDGCKSYRNSKLFDYIFHLFGGVDVRAGVFRKFPKVDFTRTWTNVELYNHFGLTKEEREYIEATVK